MFKEATRKSYQINLDGICNIKKEDEVLYQGKFFQDHYGIAKTWSGDSPVFSFVALENSDPICVVQVTSDEDDDNEHIIYTRRIIDEEKFLRFLHKANAIRIFTYLQEQLKTHCVISSFVTRSLTDPNCDSVRFVVAKQR